MVQLTCANYPVICASAFFCCYDSDRGDVVVSWLHCNNLLIGSLYSVLENSLFDCYHIPSIRLLTIGKKVCKINLKCKKNFVVPIYTYDIHQKGGKNRCSTSIRKFQAISGTVKWYSSSTSIASERH